MIEKYLIDTGPLTALLAERPFAVSTFRPWIDSREAATSTLVYGEIVEYLRGFADFGARRGRLVALLEEVRPIAPSLDIAFRYGDLRRQLRPPYGPGLIGDIDTLIAATAIEYGLTVVTTDSDFQRVPGLLMILIPRDALRS